MAKPESTGQDRADENRAERDARAAKREEARENARQNRAASAYQTWSGGSDGGGYDPFDDLESRLMNPKGRVMRNRWGVEIKKGYYAWFRGGRNGDESGEGVIASVDRSSDYAKAYGPLVTVTERDGSMPVKVSFDAIQSVLPPMKIGRGGVVKANPVIEVRELFLFATNNYSTFQKAKKALDGDETWNAVATNAARVYSADFGSGASKWREIFTPDDIKVVASMLREHYTEEQREDNPLSRVKINSPSQLTGLPPSARLIKRRRKTARQIIPGVYANPAERETFTHDSQRPRETVGKRGRPTTTKAASRRLVKRRKITATMPAGFFANPKAREGFHVWSTKNGERDIYRAWFATLEEAKKYAQELAAKTNRPAAIVEA